MFYITSITLILTIVFKNISNLQMFLFGENENTMADTCFAQLEKMLKNKQFTSHTIYFKKNPFILGNRLGTLDRSNFFFVRVQIW